jgi:uncharacterized integral membrane protein
MRFLRRSDEDTTAQEAHGEEPAGESRLGKLLVLIAIAAYAVGFVLENHKQVKVHFVFTAARVSLIWLILLSLALGLIGGRLLPRLYRRRRRRH